MGSVDDCRAVMTITMTRDMALEMMTALAGELHKRRSTMGGDVMARRPLWRGGGSV